MAAPEKSGDIKKSVKKADAAPDEAAGSTEGSSSITGIDDLITAGRDRGFVSIVEIETQIDAELTPEQIQELRTDLTEQGIDLVDDDGKAPTETETEKKASVPRLKAGAKAAAQDDYTDTATVDSLRLYLRSIGRVELLT